MDLFRYQYAENNIYQQYCSWLGKSIENVNAVSQIPLLPVSAFKSQNIVSGIWEPQTVFRSSGTTQSVRSVHHVRDVSLYLKHTEFLWQNQFGALENYCFLALLPGYIERGESSLVEMVNYFVGKSRNNGSEFILGKEDVLQRKIRINNEKKIKTVLFGVSFALMEMIDKGFVQDENLCIVETGGMKGLREDLTKDEMLSQLQKGFGTVNVYSEYGMTELFSQAYTDGSTNFRIHPYLDIHVRQLQDPLEEETVGKQGMIGCTDLANIDSCAFILSEDSGLKTEGGTFQLTGRVQNADIRGCNLLLDNRFV
jgi:hypothetical protein